MRLAVATALGAWLAVAAPSAQSNMARPEKYTAFAVDISNTSPGARTSPVDITINRWSTDAEREQLLSVFRDKGQDALLEALQKLPVVGYINTPGSLRYDLHFIWEAVNRPRTIDYPFTLIQLQLDKDGNGVGKASIYTKITQAKDGTIELENFSSQPVNLNQIRKVR